MSHHSENLIRAREIAALPEEGGHHRLNADSELWVRTLSDLTGMKRIGLHIARVPPGKESTEYHSHHHEEEFFFVLSGQGTAIIDGSEHAIGAGDFLGFRTPSAAHAFVNDSDEDLVYLMGGERREFEVGEFPRHGLWAIREGKSVRTVREEALEEMLLPEAE